MLEDDKKEIEPIYTDKIYNKVGKWERVCKVGER